MWGGTHTYEGNKVELDLSCCLGYLSQSEPAAKPEALFLLLGAASPIRRINKLHKNDSMLGVVRSLLHSFGVFHEYLPFGSQ